MSFLVRRNLPLARQGKVDTFQRPDESPVRQPWGVWGTQPCTAQIESGRLRFGAGSAWTNFGGWSYEYYPLTQHYEYRVRMACTKSGAVAEKIDLCIAEAWSRVGPTFTDILSVAIQYRTSGINCRVMILGYANATSVGDIYAEAQIPQSAFDGTAREYVIRVYSDRYVQVFYEGSLVCAAPIPTAFRTAPLARALNALNGITTNVYLDIPFRVRDIVAIPPFESHAWASHFFDDFNRANNATVGNGWAEVGQSINIQTNSLAIPSGFPTDGIRCAWQSANPTSTGNQRAEFVLGGSQNPTAQPSGALLRVNSAGTLAIAVRFTSTVVWIEKWTGSLSSPTITNVATFANTISGGVKYAACVYGDYVWAEDAGGNVIALYGGANALSPNINHHYGAALYRTSFVDSASFNEYRALAA